MRPSLYLGAYGLAVATFVKVLAYRELEKAGISTTEQCAHAYAPVRWTESGPYGLVRHPVYWSLLASLAAIGVMAFDWPGAVLALPAWPHFRQRMVLEDNLRLFMERRLTEDQKA